MTTETRSRTSCPICGRHAAERHSPFCSERCQKLDLAHWLGERYRLPSEDAAPRDDTSDDPRD